MKRRIVRWFGVGVAGLIVVALLGALVLQLLGHRRLRQEMPAFEAAVGPLEPIERSSPELAETDDAATWLRAAASAVVLTEDERELVNRVIAPETAIGQWTEADRAAVASVLGRSAPAFALARRAVPLMQSNFARGNALNARDLLPFIRLGRVVLADARLALAAGDRARLFDDVAILGRLAAALEDEPILIVMLVGIACEKFQLEAVRDAILTDTDAATLDRLAGLLSGVDLPARLRAANANEIASALAWLEGRLPDEHYMAGYHQDERSAWRRLGQRIYGRYALAEILRVTRDVAAHSGEATARMQSEVVRPAGLVAGVAADGMLSLILPPPVPRENLINIDGRAHAQMRLREMARIAIVMRRQRLAGSAYPASLPAELAAVATTSRPPIVYRRGADGDASIELENGDGYWPQLGRFDPARTLLRWPLP